jgi:hypothetical protein
MSPTQRTLKECKRRNWTAGIVERRVPFKQIAIDLFGCIDIVVATPDGILGIQATSGTNHAARMAKARQEPRLAAWLGAGARFEVWSWAKRGDRGKRKLWALRAEAVTL